MGRLKPKAQKIHDGAPVTAVEFRYVKLQSVLAPNLKKVSSSELRQLTAVF